MEKTVGRSVGRIDGVEKVTGKAQYTDDFLRQDMLYAKIFHANIASGNVVNIDISRAEKVDGVVKIMTCFDAPEITFGTAGHIWSTDPGHQDIQDRHLLTKTVRFYGDEIAAVIAETELACDQALRLITAEYEVLEPVLNVASAMSEGAHQIHEKFPGNVLKTHSFAFGDWDSAMSEPGLIHVEGTYQTPIVQHCHIENPVCFAYSERDKITVVSSTQIPHIVRRIVGQALGIGWGSVRVVKPFLGGGFGNKQDILYEPLAAWLSLCVAGRCVKVVTSREECFFSTRVRHAIKFKLDSWVRADGTFVARQMQAWSNQGAYASHGHSIVANAANQWRQLYSSEAVKATATTVFTNTPVAGAMRGYGIPQACFAIESHTEDIAKVLGVDSMEIRKKNMMKQGYIDPGTKITANTCGLSECIELGKKYMGETPTDDGGNIRRGRGMAIFCYKTAIYPISMETASARMMLNEDGSVQLQSGATEIGQGADTVFSQMAAQVLGIDVSKVHIVSTQDTDVGPFDPGAFASRQTYVSGSAVKQTAELLKTRILEYAAGQYNVEKGELDIVDGIIVRGDELIASLAEMATEAVYSLSKSSHITAESTFDCKTNTFATGVTFADIEIDVALGKISVTKIINVHDSGTIINPQLAAMQVHGGISMGLGFGLFEQLIIDPNTGKVLNDNLLDYKLMTTMDTPDMCAEFVELPDPTGPFGNKALGEPPAIPPAAAVRNAVLSATGVAFDECPLSPERVLAGLQKAGMIDGYC